MRKALFAGGLPIAAFVVAVASHLSLYAAVGRTTVAQAAQVPPGKILFGSGGNLWLWADGGVRQLTSGGRWYQPRWSPDGSHIAYVYREINFSETFTMRSDGSYARQLTHSQAYVLSDDDWVFHPTWSPDGQQIAFVTDAASFLPMLWIMKADGSGRRQLLPAAGPWDAVDGISWDPSGRRMAIASFRTGTGEISVLDVARPTVLVQVTHFQDGVLDPAWSPDGAHIAFTGREGSATNIYVMQPSGSGRKQLTRSGQDRAPAWSPAGDWLAYISSQTGSFEVWAVPVSQDSTGAVTAGEPEQLTHGLAVDATSGLSWAR